MLGPNFSGLVHHAPLAAPAMKRLMEGAALLLSVVNGTALFRNYLRDKPKLRVEAVHSEIYQWWFPLASGIYRGAETRSYGFLVYVTVKNSGLRKVELSKWGLKVKNRLLKTESLPPMNAPEIQLTIGSHQKFIAMLGQHGAVVRGDVLVDSGCSLSGMAFFRYECFGGEGWSPLQRGNEIQAEFWLEDVFGGKASTKIRLMPKTHEFFEKIAPGFLESLEEMNPSAKQSLDSENPSTTNV